VLYQRLALGRAVALAMLGAHNLGGDDDEEIEAGREGCSRSGGGEVVVMWVE